jgi:thiosulfate dehydrogenase
MFNQRLILFFAVVALCVASMAATPTSGDTDMPAGQLGDAIRQGKRLVTDTLHAAPAYVGNGLNCASCHLDAGTRPDALPLTGLSGQFPVYNARIGRVITLEDRINGCFLRSMNGKALPLDSAEMTSLVAYITWLSRGVAVGANLSGRGSPPLDTKGLHADPKHGQQVFQAACASCHGANGAGVYGQDGQPIFPALWGDKSFNLGAGMARLNTAAAFVHANMPQNQPGSLTAQEALDVAAFFTTQARPDYADKQHDWPHGDKPADARY